MIEQTIFYLLAFLAIIHEVVALLKSKTIVHDIQTVKRCSHEAREDKKNGGTGKLRDNWFEEINHPGLLILYTILSALYLFYCFLGLFTSQWAGYLILLILRIFAGDVHKVQKQVYHVITSSISIVILGLIITNALVFRVNTFGDVIYLLLHYIHIG